MPIVCDAHVHIYPNYSLEVFFKSAFCGLAALSDKFPEASSCAKALILTERGDCNFFKAISNGSLNLASFGYSFSVTSEADCLRIINPKQEELFLFAGRQIVTKERLEVLAITSDSKIADGKAFSDVMKFVLDVGAVPVLNWAPGKWMFKRKPIVQKIIDEVSPDKLLICDTTLRPSCYPEPSLMKRARLNGFRVIAGSDPLPLKGEEKLVGTYGVFAKAALNQTSPVTSMRELLLSPEVKLDIVGKRCGLLKTTQRLLAHRKNK